MTGARFVLRGGAPGAVPSEVERFRLVADAAGVDRSIDQGAATPLTWAEVARRLAPVRSYWLSTTGRSGAPQVAPVWGAVLDDTLYLYSERDTAKARNLAGNPRVALHLADADDVLIVHGEVEDLGLPTGRPEVMDAFRAKYVAPADASYLPDADPAFDVLWALRPARALTWLLESFEDSRRRWTRPA
jgi:Pyridoxamine 5'-phosphate oxidase